MADNLAKAREAGVVFAPRRAMRRSGDAEVRARLRGDKAFLGGILAISLVAVLPLVLILAFVIVRGASSINWQFLTELPKPMGETGGGISNAIVGTVILIFVASVISIPLGILAGIFLSESGKSGLGRLTRLSVETLMGVPSIVIGIVAYVWVVRSMGHFSAFSGGVALAMIMLPVITLSTEETLLLIPVSLREAALALGVSYPRTVLKVILPAGQAASSPGRSWQWPGPLVRLPRFCSRPSAARTWCSTFSSPWRPCRRRSSSMRRAPTPNGSPLPGAPRSCSWSSSWR